MPILKRIQLNTPGETSYRFILFLLKYILLLNVKCIDKYIDYLILNQSRYLGTGFHW